VRETVVKLALLIDRSIAKLDLFPFGRI